MPVYIDPPRWPAHGTEFSHMVSDTSLEELHTVAHKIGLSIRAFDRDHYDLPRERYDDAVRAGAIEVDGKQLVRILRASGLRIPAVQRSTKVLPVLRRRWERAIGHTPELQEIREILLTAWNEPHRHYHNGVHLLAVLTALDALTDSHPPVEVVLAAWFHDAVYTGQAGADEQASAELAQRLLSPAGFTTETIDEVVRLIGITTNHTPDSHDLNGALLSDADLAILGSAPGRYAEYIRAVRAEYAHVPKQDFVQGRLAIMGALESTEIFHTERGRDLWQRQARENVWVEIAELELATLVNLDVPEHSTVLPIAALCYVRDGALLTVRKRNTNMFMLVGGKIEDDESALEATLREAREEVGMSIVADDLQPLGRFYSPAANEPGTWIDSTVFYISVSSSDDGPITAPQALAEIEELAELDLYPQRSAATETTLAPLLRQQVVPLLRRIDRRFWSGHFNGHDPYELTPSGR